MFVPLHTKSEYSLGYGTAAPEELVESAARLGYRAIALTDLECLAGQVRFHHRCRSLGLKPITGVELRPGFGTCGAGSREGRLVLLARDREGYENLCRIVSRRTGAVSEESGTSNPLPLVARYARGLFILSDDPFVIEILVAAKEIATNSLGLLLVRPESAQPRGEWDNERFKARIEAARRLKVPLIADPDIVFLNREDHLLHQLLRAVRLQQTIHNLPADQVENPERYFRSPEEAAKSYRDLPEAIAAGEKIADACALDLTAYAIPLPSVDLLSGKSADRVLAERCGRSVKDRLREGSWNRRHAERLDQELTTFSALGFSSYLLVSAAIVDFCNERSIPVITRGSAVSSLTLHLLGASPVNPIAEGLFFERFLHPEKSAWPDVDLDLPSDRRDEVIAWVYKRFGRDRVAMVSAHHRFQRRSALREGLKALGIGPSVILKLVKALPPEDMQVENYNLADLADAGKIPEPADLKAVLSLVQRLVGRVRQIAAHPGGIVVSPQPLDSILALEEAAKGVVITQYDYTDTGSFGLMKIDLLGNKALSEMEEIFRFTGPARLDTIPAEDRETLGLIDRAETIGCFQLESPAMRSLLSRIPVRTQDDIVAALALIRPGAAAGQAKAAFIRRARREEPFEDIDPAVSDRLGRTQGLLLYEEDIMALLSRVGGLSLAEADNLRAAIVDSGGRADVLAALKRDFVASALRPGAAGNHGRLSQARLEKAWDAAARFAAYSFNKAHAASYGRLAYISAYLKMHHPAEFTCALLNHHQGMYPLRTIAAEMTRRGVIVRPPHVNLSGCDSLVERSGNGAESKRVRIGLNAIKTQSRQNSFRIVEERLAHGWFTGLADFLDRMRISVRELEPLVLSGACDGLMPLDPDSYPFIHEAVLKNLKEGISPVQIEALRAAPAVSEDGRRRRLLYGRLARATNELRWFKMSVTAHPIALLRDGARRNGCIPIEAAIRRREGNPVRILAMIAAMRRVPTVRGVLQFLSFEDETGILEGVVLPPLYARLGGLVTTSGPFYAGGRLIENEGAVTLEITELVPFHFSRDSR